MLLSQGHENKTAGFYLPHHTVIKADSLTTKNRVVFDGSSKTSTGISLNDTLMVGPKLQDDLFVILTRYRSHVYAFMADIEKMYRQIRVHPDDAIYQKIIYRENSQLPINTYVLETVTYGTACAPHLAICSLQQLANDDGHLHPLAAVVVKRDFYVDDLLTGANTLVEAEILRDQLIALLKRGGFNLRKWSSNHPSFVSDYPTHPKSASKPLDHETSVKTLPFTSKLNQLSPYLDEFGVLRVGGRLVLSSLPDSQRHPILLPAHHYVTRLIINQEHVRLMHAGAQATLYSLRQNYWLIDGRNVIRKIIHQCISCFRAKPCRADPNSGILPECQVNYTWPFLQTGIDYCGPLFIKERRFRNRNKLKVYVAIFVCMATKAVHLELVSDLTTEAFIASLKRFFAPRGKVFSIYSDNATNFVGANRELSELFATSKHQALINKYCKNECITWHFIPPRSPHFGGIWEAAVKSFKIHLVRTVGEALLTYEHLNTYLVEIEAILNSRPLSPMSSDLNDLLPLTPGHFLIGGPLTSLPETDFTETSSNRLSAWQHAQYLKQHFWARWSKEYLNNLMKHLHQSKEDNLQVGRLVLLLDENQPPLSWPMGKITAVHPGKDGIVRVATVKTSNSEYKRCVKKLCPLPIE